MEELLGMSEILQHLHLPGKGPLPRTTFLTWIEKANITAYDQGGGKRHYYHPKDIDKLLELHPELMWREEATDVGRRIEQLQDDVRSEIYRVQQTIGKITTLREQIEETLKALRSRSAVSEVPMAHGLPPATSIGYNPDEFDIFEEVVLTQTKSHLLEEPLIPSKYYAEAHGINEATMRDALKRERAKRGFDDEVDFSKGNFRFSGKVYKTVLTLSGQKQFHSVFVAHPSMSCPETCPFHASNISSE